MIKSRLLAGVISLLFVVVTIIVPPIIANRLERVETIGREDIVSFTELISEYENQTSSEWIWDNESYSYYVPYTDFNEDTLCEYSLSSSIRTGHCAVRNAGTYINPASTSYNDVGYVDSVTYSSTDLTTLYFLMGVDFDGLYEDGVDVLYINYTSYVESTFNLQGVVFRCLDSNHVAESGKAVGFTGLDTSGYTGSKSYTIEIPSATLTTIAGYETDYPLDQQLLEVRFHYISPNYGGSTHDIDIQICPEWMQESGEIENGYWDNQTIIGWDNQTVTYYEPYLRTISNTYAITRVSLGISGILLLALAWIASPYGERFDGIFPVNHVSSRSKRGRRAR